PVTEVNDRECALAGAQPQALFRLTCQTCAEVATSASDISHRQDGGENTRLSKRANSGTPMGIQMDRW
ncbi:MAG: hypothetical protein QGF59_29220, partial [Pirellulaceae bacterium]|nr:hypothetical protein [Pirellulaceae bacterium]